MEKALQKEDLIQIVIFDLASEKYGVKISDVYEIIRMLDITRVPRAEDFVEGVINLRGKIIPVIDLRKRFGFPVQTDKKQNRIIVVKVDDHTVGLIVDDVSEVLQVPASSIEEVSGIVFSQIDTEFLSGIAKIENKLVIMLNLSKVLSKKEKKSLKDAESEMLMLGGGK
ncbi:MAG: chemotaxis protein CheW [Planctomycetes bacterium]|nr:chemotaxis protein CheW [Planctomycetota bacterium]